MKVLLKISWEALKWEKDFGFDEKMLEKVAKMIKKIKKENIWLAIVIGWGNIYRWWNLINSWVNPADSHNLSMLSTVFNWVVLKNFLEKVWIESVVMDPNNIKFILPYNKDLAKKYIEKNIVVIFTGGTWNPYFSTDTWGVLRALEIEADMMIKATRVNWIYDSDPEKNPNAKFFEKISYHKILEEELKVMDLSAIDIAKNNWLVLKVVNLFKEDAVLKAILWEKEWTIVTS